MFGVFGSQFAGRVSKLSCHEDSSLHLEVTTNNLDWKDDDTRDPDRSIHVILPPHPRLARMPGKRNPEHDSKSLHCEFDEPIVLQCQKPNDDDDDDCFLED